MGISSLLTYAVIWLHPRGVGGSELGLHVRLSEQMKNQIPPAQVGGFHIESCWHSFLFNFQQ